MSQVQKEKLHSVVVKEFTSTFRGHKRVKPGKPGRRRKQFRITISNTLPESDDRVQKMLSDRQREREVKQTAQRLAIVQRDRAREAEKGLDRIFNESVKKVLGAETAAAFETAKNKKRKAQQRA